MAHVGPAFGDNSALNQKILNDVRVRDMLYLEAIHRRDKNALFAHMREDHDARRVCGFPAVYTLLDLFERIAVGYTAELFDYRQAVDEQGTCGVTFCGMGFYQNDTI
jgi:hypothetical protein